MKKTHISLLLLSFTINACAPKKASESASTEANLADGVEYCVQVSGDKNATCFIEKSTGAKKEFLTTADSYEQLLLAPSFANENVLFEKISDQEYINMIAADVIPTVTLKDEKLSIFLDSLNTDDSANKGFKLPGRVGSFGGGLGKISPNVFKAGKAGRLKSFIHSFTKGFTKGGAISKSRVGGGVLALVSGIFGMIGFGNWAAGNSRSAPAIAEIENMEMDVILPKDYAAAE